MSSILTHLCSHEKECYFETKIHKSTDTIQSVVLSASPYYKGDFEKPYQCLRKDEVKRLSFTKSMYVVLLVGRLDIHVVKIKKLNELADVIHSQKEDIKDLRIINIQE